MKITLNNPPHGYLPEADYRAAIKGETVIPDVCEKGASDVYVFLGTSNKRRIVLSPIPSMKGPSILTWGWMAKDADNIWWLFDELPTLRGLVWDSNSPALKVCPYSVSWEEPEVHWSQSLIVIGPKPESGDTIA